MRRSKLLTAAVTALTGFGLLVSNFSVALAATTSTTQVGGNGMLISPVRTDLVINPGSSAQVDVFVQNVTAFPATYQAIVNDFVANPDESGTPKLILNPNQSAPAHGLKNYVAPIPNFTLQPGQETDIKVHINIPKTLAGGGYYGAVRFAPAGAGTSGGNISLSASVASLILVKVTGNIVDSLSVNSFGVENGKGESALFYTSGNGLQAIVRFQNNGNVQEEPFGKILLKKGNTQLGSYEINQETPPGNVLPGSIRYFTVHLTNVKGAGHYTLEGNFGYGTTGQLLTAKTTFWVLPLSYVIGAIGLVVLIVLLIVIIPRWRKGYERRVINRYNKRRGSRRG